MANVTIRTSTQTSIMSFLPLTDMLPAATILVYQASGVQIRSEILPFFLHPLPYKMKDDKWLKYLRVGSSPSYCKWVRQYTVSYAIRQVIWYARYQIGWIFITCEYLSTGKYMKCNQLVYSRSWYICFREIMIALLFIKIEFT